MVRELTEWEETYSDKIKKLNDEVTLDVITHFIKKNSKWITRNIPKSKPT